MAKDTPATRALRDRRIAFTLHEYDYDSSADSIGFQAAAAMGVPAPRVFKTLMMRAGDAVLVVMMPSDAEVSLKKLAAAAGAKQAAMLPPAEAERLTGYRIGGISPLGQRRASSAFIDDSVSGHDTVFVNGGRRGLQICLAPADLIAATGARVAPLAAS